MLLKPATHEDIASLCAIEAMYPQYITVQSAEAHHAALDDPNFAYLAAHDDSGQLTGYVILVNVLSPSHNVELRRIAIRNPSQKLGRPIFQEAVRLAFTQYNAHRLWLDVAEENTRAQALYRSVGFQQEGIMREAHLHDGRYHSLLLMSLLDREFKEQMRA